MITTVEALINLYVAKGGSLSDVEDLNTIPDLISALAEFQEEMEVPVSSAEINEIVNSIS